MEDFRSDFREGMKRFRDDFQNGKLRGEFDGCQAAGRLKIRRDSGSEEFRETQVDFHRDSRTKQADQSKSVSYENNEGGN